MKCEKCKEREANFFYTATINGETTQKRLCSQCAAEEGLDKAFDFGKPERSLFDDFFLEPFALMDSFFGRRSLFGSLMPTMTLPRSLFAPVRETAQETEEAPAESRIPADAGEEIRAQRELSALKHQLQEAVKAEDFEKAIELRDQIRQLENN